MPEMPPGAAPMTCSHCPYRPRLVAGDDGIPPCEHHDCHLEGAIPCDAYLRWKRRDVYRLRANHVARLRLSLLEAVRSAPPELLARLRELVDLWPAA